MVLNGPSASDGEASFGQWLVQKEYIPSSTIQQYMRLPEVKGAYSDLSAFCLRVRDGWPHESAPK
ncbi:hypothetical protein HBH98_253150 [Parastagonospora nodorum]|nr:hypothetical protein HBH53_263640 [Parastagonospora nodorum]KAH3956101.1 hypothetical protein HBH51_255340 [Parastagonospora nodorum]KAH4332767.1 hypothetical protein HBH98_253150 [Parastagonospora nodorum]KAH4893139.1 hypothetical protein HBI80_253200 [Parastagonospora nodorum]KAH5088391.1 hypothetical protein HBH72_247760 [Parastagonospora nodorum]